MLPDVIISKISIMENCLSRIRQSQQLKHENIFDESMMLDFVVLNLQRSIQASIDMADYIISDFDYRTPNSYKMSFLILQEKNWLSGEVYEKMSKMVGFRNIAVHDYREINYAIVKSIVSDHLDDFKEFISSIVQKYEKDSTFEA